MEELLPALRRWLARGEDVALGVVVATRRSAPRPVGSALAVSSGGELAGSVSAGCVENEVAHEAREVLSGGEPRLRTYGISDEQALGVGLPCGGEIDVYVSRADSRLLGRAVDEIESGRVVRPRVVDGRLDLTSRPAPRLVVVGAVELAEALCRAAKPLGWRTIVVDPRLALATTDRLPSADDIVTEWPDAAFARLELDDETAVVVLAHEARIDLPALATALASDAYYVGALGSRRTQAQRREQLAELGVTDDALERIRGPVGLDVGAETPAETAVAIVAEMLAARSGRDARPLRERTERIHADVAV